MRIDEVIVVLFFVLVVLPLFFAYLYSLRFVFKYEVDQYFFRVKLFGIITLRRVSLGDIETINIVEGWKWPDPSAFFFAERWPNQVFTKRGVLIKKRTGLSRFLFLSPENPEEFILKINTLRSIERQVKTNQTREIP